MDYEQIERVVDLAVEQGGWYEEQLLQIFQPLIHATARSYYHRYCEGLVEVEDCVVYASIAFIWLTRRYKRNRCRRFVTYIKRYIQPQMQKLFESELHVPRRAYYRARHDQHSLVREIVFPDQLSTYYQ